MKKILVLLAITASAFFISCDGGDDEAPAAGNGSVNIQGTYTGLGGLDPEIKDDVPKAGDGKIHVFIFDTISANAPASAAYFNSTETAVEKDDPFDITVTGIPAGDYYILVYYDYRDHNLRGPGNKDRYQLYDGVFLSDGASKITVTENNTTTITGVTLTDAHSFGSDGLYQ